MKTFKNLSLALLVATVVPGIINASSKEQRRTYYEQLEKEYIPLVDKNEVVLFSEKSYIPAVPDYNSRIADLERLHPGRELDMTEMVHAALASRPKDIRLTLVELIEASQGKKEGLDKIVQILEGAPSSHVVNRAAELLWPHLCYVEGFNKETVIFTTQDCQTPWVNAFQQTSFAVELTTNESIALSKISKPFVKALQARLREENKDEVISKFMSEIHSTGTHNNNE